MTLSTTASSGVALGNGTTFTFFFQFTPDSASDISVVYTAPNGVSTPLAPTAYSINIPAPAVGQLWPTSFSILYPLSGQPIPNGSSLTASRILPLQQLTSLQNQGNQWPNAVEEGMDTLEMQIQQVNTAVQNISFSMGTPNELIGYDNNGDITTVTVGSGLTLVNNTLTGTGGGGGGGGGGSVSIINTAGLLSGGPITSAGTITTSVDPGILVGRYSAGVGVMQEIVLGNTLLLTGNTLNVVTGTSPYDILTFFPGTTVNSQLLYTDQMVRPITFPINFAGGYASAVTAATSATTFTVLQNATTVGHIIFAPSQTTATLSAASAISLNTGDYLTIENQATADATLANISVSLTGTRTGSGGGSGLGTVTEVDTAGLISGGPINTTGTVTTSVPTNTLVGRYTAGTGVMQSVTIGTNLALTGAGVLNATALSATGTLVKVNIISTSGTWTKQAATNSIEVELWAGGGGGASESGSAGGVGGNTTFDVMTANGGAGGSSYGGLGGASSGGGLNMTGNAGGNATSSGFGGVGGMSPRGGGGGGVVGSGTAPVGGFPGGGGGVSQKGANVSAAGGGGGGYSYKYYQGTAPTSMAVVIGAVGTAGTTYGGVGGAGLCVIKEYT